MSQFSSNGQEYEEYRDEYVLNDSEKQLILAMARNDLGKVKEILSDLEKPEEINLFITKDRKCYTSLFLDFYLKMNEKLLFSFASCNIEPSS